MCEKYELSSVTEDIVGSDQNHAPLGKPSRIVVDSRQKQTSQTKTT